MSIPLSYSLRARLLFFLLAAIVVGALVQGTIAYRSTLQQADDIFDSLLQRTALSLGTGDGLLSTGPTHARGAGTPFADDLIIQIWTPDGLRVFNSRSRQPLPDQIVLGFSDAKVEGSTYRVYSLATPFQVIQVAQDMGVRTHMARSLALRTIAPIAAAAPLLMLVIWCVVSWSLRPVKRARAQVAARQPEDLSPVSTEGVPDEIRPLLQELNLLLERMRLRAAKAIRRRCRARAALAAGGAAPAIASLATRGRSRVPPRGRATPDGRHRPRHPPDRAVAVAGPP